MKRNIAKIAALLIMTTFIAAMPTIASASVVVDLEGTWDWTFYLNGNPSLEYPHTMEIDYFNPATGDFSGTGYYNTNPAITWDITGNVDGITVTFTIDYNNINPNYYVDALGTIDSGGFSMSGTATAPGQTATWDAEKEIPIQLTFPEGSTAIAEIQILEELPPCTPDLPDALDIIPLISVKITSGEFDGMVQICIQYDDSELSPEQEEQLRLYISNCVDFNLDGTINGKDINLIMKAIKAGDVEFSEEGVPFDVNNDGSIDEEDVLIVKEYASSGLIVNLDLYELEQARLPWIDITTSVDTELNIICGQTEHFSLFRCR